MNKTLLIMAAELRASLGRKTFTLFAFGLPLLLAMVASVFILINRDKGTVDSGATGPRAPELAREGYVDPGRLIATLPPNVPPDWLRPYPTEQAAQQALDAGEISAYYVIPPDYIETGEITYAKLTHNPLSNAGFMQSMAWVVLFNIAGQDQALATSLWQPLELSTVALTPPADEAGEPSWLVEMLPTLMTLILYLVIIMASSALVTSVSEEKKNRVLEIVLSSTSTNQFMAGKILALGLLGLLMMASWLGLLWFIATFGGASLQIPAGYELPTELLLWAVVYGFLGYAMYGALMAGVGAVAPDVKDTRSATFVVMLPLILAYMLNMFVVDAPQGSLALAASFFPLTSPVTMITRMSATDVPAWQAVLAALLQLFMAVLIVRLVARVFRAKLLLSGQPASIRLYASALLGRA